VQGALGLEALPGLADPATQTVSVEMTALGLKAVASLQVAVLLASAGLVPFAGLSAGATVADPAAQAVLVRRAAGAFAAHAPVQVALEHARAVALGAAAVDALAPQTHTTGVTVLRGEAGLRLQAAARLQVAAPGARAAGVLEARLLAAAAHADAPVQAATVVGADLWLRAGPILRADQAVSTRLALSADVPAVGVHA